MSAAKQPKRDPKEKADLFIAKYQETYSHALDEAREASATTTTAAWQTNYKNQIEAHRKIVGENLRTISSACDTIKHQDTAEDFEKDIRDAVKALAEERIRFSAWKARTVAPFQAAADRCAAILISTNRAAEEAERNSPLIDVGLLAEIRNRTNKWPVAKWNDEVGVVEVVDRETGEVSEAA